MNELRDRKMIDDTTRSLTAYFNTYNANENMIATVRVLIEFPHWGGVRRRMKV